MNTENILTKLYSTMYGRVILKVLTNPVFSKTLGRYLDSSVSRIHINSFIKSKNIDMDDYITQKYKSFNDFFIRKVRKSARPISFDPSMLIAPCDAKLLVYKISSDRRIKIKGSEYNVAELLRNNKLAQRYEDGICLVFRLSVDNYHRYCYIDDGQKSRNVRINGILNTVQPVALERRAVFKENTREYTILRTDNFGDVIQMEVGAMLVGRISNNDEKGIIKRGKEKGMFLYGGSTIILLIKDGIVNINPDILENSKRKKETPVKMGQVIAERD